MPDDVTIVLCAVVLVALSVWCWRPWTYGGDGGGGGGGGGGWRRGGTPYREPMRPYQASPSSVARGSATNAPPRSQPAGVPPNPLEPYLRRARVAPPQSVVPSNTTDVVADHASEEAREVARIVVDRVNRASPNVRMTLVAVESVRKAVDAYKTLRYDMVINVYSAGLNMAARVACVVLRSGDGTVYVTHATADGGAHEPDPTVGRSSAAAAAGVQGSLGPGFEEDFSTFAPAI